MKLPCELIEDLLPLYHDEVCSEKTKELVEEHLAQCKSCQSILQSIDYDIIAPKQDSKSIAIMKNIKKEIRTKEAKSALLILLVFIIILSLYYALQFRLRPVSTDNMNITQVSETSDGTIAFHLEMLGGSSFQTAGPTPDENDPSIMYITPISAIIPDTTGYKSTYLFYNIENSYFYGSFGFGEYTPFETTNIDKLYLGTEKDRILIWEEGMELPEASDLFATEYEKGLKYKNANILSK